LKEKFGGGFDINATIRKVLIAYSNGFNTSVGHERNYTVFEEL
jgi:hypothetical protein